MLDTNVLVVAARSRRGASFALVSSIPAAEFKTCLSIGLFSEWQAVLSRSENVPPGLSADDALAFCRFLAYQSDLQEIHYRWRPFLPDPNDGMVLELAFAAGCQHIITHNTTDFQGSEELGIEALGPRDFLNLVRRRP